jgi:hypothetical protein
MDLQPKSLLVMRSRAKLLCRRPVGQVGGISNVAYQDDGFRGGLSALSDWNFQ